MRSRAKLIEVADFNEHFAIPIAECSDNKSPDPILCDLLRSGADRIAPILSERRKTSRYSNANKSRRSSLALMPALGAPITIKASNVTDSDGAELHPARRRNRQLGGAKWPAPILSLGC